jgi:hypothetical protein
LKKFISVNRFIKIHIIGDAFVKLYLDDVDRYIRLLTNFYRQTANTRPN